MIDSLRSGLSRAEPAARPLATPRRLSFGVFGPAGGTFDRGVNGKRLRRIEIIFPADAARLRIEHLRGLSRELAQGAQNPRSSPQPEAGTIQKPHVPFEMDAPRHRADGLRAELLKFRGRDRFHATRGDGEVAVDHGESSKYVRDPSPAAFNV